MCGICGHASLKRSNEELLTNVRSMTELLIHRGPDGSGYFSDSGVALGMRRLAIIDIEGGAQPFVGYDGSLSLVCNGEIYNHRQMRETLTHLGYEFRSQSDVEVILHGYKHFGEDIFEMLEGMFAVALWDQSNRKLILARDRFGIKPLFFARTDQGIAFSSELRSISSHPEISRRIDLTSLTHYLAFDYVPAPRSIYSEVQRLKPGHLLTWHNDTITERRYWELSLRQSETRPPIDIREYTEAFRETLSASISREMDADVPVGIFLSGGLDSSSIAAFAAHLRPGVQTFSARFEDPSFDETPLAQLTSRHLGTNHRVLDVTQGDCIETASKIGTLLDEPLADSSFVPTFLLSQFARKYVTVALGGDGGDELFAGYQTHKAHKIIDFYERTVPYTLRTRAIPTIVQRLPVSLRYVSFDFKARRFLKGRGVPFASRHHRWMGSFDERESLSILDRSLRLDYLDPYAPAFQALKDCDALSIGNQALFLDTKLYLEGDILAKVDRASMHHSLEVRVPLLNRKIVDFTLRLPYELKLRGMTSKYFLKHAMRGLLPREILAQKKKGFNFPVGRYMVGPLREIIRDTLSPSALRHGGLFNPDSVETLLNDHFSGKADNTKQIWSLYTFESWRTAQKASIFRSQPEASTPALRVFSA